MGVGICPINILAELSWSWKHVTMCYTCYKLYMSSRELIWHFFPFVSNIAALSPLSEKLIHLILDLTQTIVYVKVFLVILMCIMIKNKQPKMKQKWDQSITVNTYSYWPTISWMKLILRVRQFLVGFWIITSKKEKRILGRCKSNQSMTNEGMYGTFWKWRIDW